MALPATEQQDEKAVNNNTVYKMHNFVPAEEEIVFAFTRQARVIALHVTGNMYCVIKMLLVCFSRLSFLGPSKSRFDTCIVVKSERGMKIDIGQTRLLGRVYKG